jgi:hypothetical protein
MSLCIYLCTYFVFAFMQSVTIYLGPFQATSVYLFVYCLLFTFFQPVFLSSLLSVVSSFFHPCFLPPFLLNVSSRMFEVILIYGLCLLALYVPVWRSKFCVPYACLSRELASRRKQFVAHYLNMGRKNCSSWNKAFQHQGHLLQVCGSHPVGIHPQYVFINVRLVAWANCYL